MSSQTNINDLYNLEALLAKATKEVSRLRKLMEADVSTPAKSQGSFEKQELDRLLRKRGRQMIKRAK